MAQVEHHDAIAEAGLTTTITPWFVTQHPVTYENLYETPCKYKWEDRWKAFFYEGIHTGTEHPDYLTDFGIDKSKFYGSFKEYWKDVSNSYYIIEPAITHSSEINDIYKKGIVNNYIELPDGRKIIKYITLPLKKYGANESEAYFPDYNFYNFDPNHSPDELSRIELMHTNAENTVTYLHDIGQLEFDITEFKKSGGIVIFITAGSHKLFKGNSSPNNNSAIIRGMLYSISPSDDPVNAKNASTDGISCAAHEFAHVAFGWSHYAGGRNDLMNPCQTKHKDCPSHPNPILKLMEGWVNPQKLDDNLNNFQLNPVETSYEVGVVTIYGNPSAAPDFLSGECYVLENRKRIGFDEMLLKNDDNMSLTKGGLLIWHYSPYTTFPIEQGLIVDYRVKLITPENLTSSNIVISYSDPKLFFGYNINCTENYSNLLSPRSFSAENKKTGITFTDILPVNENLDSKMNFNLNYTISTPTQYDYTLLNWGENPKLISTGGKIFQHEKPKGDYNYYVNMSPGGIIDIAPGQILKLSGFKLHGSEEKNIIIKGVGYENNSESYFCEHKEFSSLNPQLNQLVDTTLLRNVKFLNNSVESSNLIISNSSVNLNNSILIENIKTNYTNPNVYNIILARLCINKLKLDYAKIFLISNIYTGDLNITECEVKFDKISKFSAEANVNLLNCSVSNTADGCTQFLNKDVYWKGLNIEDGNVNFNKITVNNAVVGITARNLSNSINILNSNFNNLIQNIWINNYYPAEGAADHIIKDNHFYGVGSTYMNAISVTNSDVMIIENNSFSGTQGAGIYLNNCLTPIIKSNIITGNNTDLSYGIVSYSSSVYYLCNTINNFYYGTLLDNSSPVLYNNEIFENSLGLYITNGSYPVLSPAFLPNNTINLAGYNYIHSNSSNEIYINNTGYASNNLLMESGINIITDDDNTPFIYMNNENYFGDPEVIKCSKNFWGTGTDPANYLYPINYFDYIPYLNNKPTRNLNCEITENTNDNTTLPQQTLLMGGLLANNFYKNYDIAADFSEQLSNSSVSNYLKKYGYENILLNKYLNDNDISELTDYFYGKMLSYNNDSGMTYSIKKLIIQTLILDSNYITALTSIDSTLSTTNNRFERFYSMIEKLRILDLIDSSYNNNGNNLFIPNIGKEKEILLKANFDSYKFKKKDDKKNIFSFLDNSIQKFSHLNTVEKCNVISNKILSEIMLTHHIPNLPPAISKIKKSSKNNLIPDKFELLQNYPNPFNPVTNIKFGIPKDVQVSLKIYDILGREVKTLINEYKQAGYYIISFDASSLSSGIYFYRIKASNYTDTKKMMVVK